MSKFLLHIVIISIVLISGCGGPGVPQITVEEEKEVESPKDAIVINEILTLPKSPIFPEQPVNLLFIIENKDSKKEATGVWVNLFDAVNFKKPVGSPFSGPV